MLRKIGLLLLVSISAPLFAQPDPLEPGRNAFVAALPGIARGDSEYQDSVLLRSYPLYPYLQAERLQWRLKKATPADAMDAAVGAYLQEQGDVPWTRKLRAQWLKSLAERKDWPRFMAFYVEERADTSLKCHALNARISTSPDAGLIAPALDIWRDGSNRPDSCDPVFAWLRANGSLGTNEIAQRVRLALEAKNVSIANYLIRQLPANQQSGYQTWANVLANPSAHLESAIQTGVEPQAVIDGFSKLARANPDNAAVVLSRISARCGEPCRLESPGSIGEMRREIALNLSWSRRSETVDQFKMVPLAALNELGHEWRVRAALWTGDWALAAQWISQMPADMLADPRWRYWRGRTAEKLGQAQAASSDYESLTQENGYYSVLAAERLGRGFTPHNRQLPGNPEARAAMSETPAFVRMREAWKIGQKSWAINEWKDVTRGYEPQQMIEVARVLSSWGWHLMAVASATQAKVFDDFDLLYPRPFKHELIGAAKRVNLPPQWVWGVLRQESLYEPNARSSANARGLLQLLPTTARNVARRNGFPAPTLESLNDPSTNLLLGTSYLREQFDTFGGRFVLVLGAYNAGPGAVRRWLPSTPLETDVWVENVPYNETRSYIQRIIWHSTVFGWEASGAPQRITPWMTPISSDLTPIPDPGQ